MLFITRDKPMQYKQGAIVIPQLSKWDVSHVYLIDFLFEKELERQVYLEPGMFDPEDFIYIYLIQTYKDVWKILFSPRIFDTKNTHKYICVKETTFFHLIQITQDEKERHQLIKELLPTGTTSLYNFCDLLPDIDMCNINCNGENN